MILQSPKKFTYAFGLSFHPGRGGVGEKEAIRREEGGLKEGFSVRRREVGQGGEKGTTKETGERCKVTFVKNYTKKPN